MQSKPEVLLMLWLSQMKNLTYTNGLRSQVLFNMDTHLWRCFGHSLRLGSMPSTSPTEAIPIPSCFSLTNNPGTPPYHANQLFGQWHGEPTQETDPDENTLWKQLKITAGTVRQPGNAKVPKKLPVPVCPHQGTSLLLDSHFETAVLGTMVPTTAFRKN